jgi:hypothetical protein
VGTIVACVLGLVVEGAAQDRIGARHRGALERFLRASRALAVISHSGVPTMIAAAAVQDWGFGPGELKVAEVVPDVDSRALEDRIVEIHARYLTTEQAGDAAAFYESAPSRRILGEVLRGSLPATDPLVRGDVAPPTDADRRAFKRFSESALGTHVRTVTPLITEDVLRAVDEAAARAIERYVTRNALPHRRQGAAPPGTRR